MVETADEAWQSLPGAWQQAFTEAWASYCGGNLGIGAVLADPQSNEVVAVGRNRVSESTEEPRTLAGNFMAHAEMNAFAAMRRFKADGLDLYTTLQPCLMCSATSVFLHVDRVFYAAGDEFFSDVESLWDNHAYSQRWKPRQFGPLANPLAGFARVVPLSVEATRSPNSNVMTQANKHTTGVAALARELAVDGTLERLKLTGSRVDDALRALWFRLQTDL